MIEQLKADLKTAKTYQDLMGENGAIKKIIKASLEGMLDAELTEHLGYEKYSPAGKNTGNSRNGKTHKTLKNDYGEIELTVPRDRNGSFEPVIVKKYEIPLWILSLEDLNTNLITNSFTANENNLLVYSIEYGVTDSVLALVQL
ncbi:MAG: transposase [Ignavibacterium album]|nr:transposase [Ignavibacterium album]